MSRRTLLVVLAAVFVVVVAIVVSRSGDGTNGEAVAPTDAAAQPAGPTIPTGPERSAYVKRIAPLGEMGFEVGVRDLNSGLHAISIGPMLQGGADPRREGIPLGQ